MPRRAKIVATLGPASSDRAAFELLLDAGLDVVRLNLSHGTHEHHRAAVELVRDAAAARGAQIPVIFDLMGPRYRLSPALAEPRTLERGERVTVGERVDTADVPIDAPELLEHLGPGERLLIDNGLVELEVIERGGPGLIAKVLTGGPIAARKGINLPDSELPFTISDKDRDDVALAVEVGADFLAASYVSRADDVVALRRVADRAGRALPIVAKLERGLAIGHLDALASEADALMVARGDLGVEVPLHRVPVLQKRIIEAGRRFGKPVIVATQMLESMIEQPRPTRAESSDVANAVFDGADALMLSGETAVGRHAPRAVETMAQIIVEAEEYGLEADASGRRLSPPEQAPGEDHRAATQDFAVADVVSAAAVFATRHLFVRQLVAFSQGGFTARMISRYRSPAPIVVFTVDPTVARRVQLLWGVRPLVIERPIEHHDEVVEVVDRHLCAAGLANPGDTIVVLQGDPIRAKPPTNLMRVHRVRG